MKTYINIRPSRAALLLVMLVVGIYLLTSFGILQSLGSVLRTYVIPSVLWIFVVFIVLILPKYRLKTKRVFRKNILWVSLLIGGFQVISYCIAGLFSGFGKNPNSFAPLYLFANLVLVITNLVGMEFSRAWLINHLGKKKTFLAIVFVSVLYTLLSVPMSRLLGIRLETETIPFLNSTLIPTLVENLLASTLTLLAGPWVSIAYRGILEAFWWFCPILPDLSWAYKGIIGSMVPIIGMITVNTFYSDKKVQGKREKRSKEGFPVGWVMTSIVGVVMIWFSAGFFPYHPSLVGSGSMQPEMYPGDIVIIAKTSADVIKEGDIIEFRQSGDVKIMHRVIDIIETDGKKQFITKGDDNDSADTDPVIPQNVVGKVVITVPKIGWIAIIVKNFFTG